MKKGILENAQFSDVFLTRGEERVVILSEIFIGEPKRSTIVYLAYVENGPLLFYYNKDGKLLFSKYNGDREPYEIDYFKVEFNNDDESDIVSKY